jgi:hypothetical protein
MELGNAAQAASAYQLVIDKAGNRILGQTARLGLAEQEPIGPRYRVPQQIESALPRDGQPGCGGGVLLGLLIVYYWDQILEFLHLLPNGFSTPTTTTLAFIKAGYSVAFEPIDAEQRQGKSKIKLARDGAKFFLILLKIITIFSPLKIFVPVSVVTFLLGFGYAIWTAVRQSHVTNSSVLLILLAVVIFLVGLVSEQISALRFERRQ